MSAYTPQLAPIVVLAFLGSGFLLAVSVLLLVGGLMRKSPAVLRLGWISSLVLLLCYSGILLGFSLLSREVVLPMGGWKYFCEIDCHVANSVSGMRTIASAGPEMAQVVGNAKFVVIELKTWFDPATISAHRGNGPLMPNARLVHLEDASGRFYEQSAREDAVLAALGVASTPLRTALRPGESYVSYVVFEVPSGASGFRLLLTSADQVNALLWGDENSVWHKKISFSLQPERNVKPPRSS
jgi:hypothetical protein